MCVVWSHGVRTSELLIEPLDFDGLSLHPTADKEPLRDRILVQAVGNHVRARHSVSLTQGGAIPY